jgi:hypothetical protein
MKLVVLAAVGAALLGVRVWGAHRRGELFERARRSRRLPFRQRPAAVKFLVATAVVILVAAAYLSFNGAAS